MQKPITSISIVNHKTLNQDFFALSLNSALSQIGIKNYIINIYLDNIAFEIDHPLVNIISIPQNIQSNIIKVREFIIENTKTKYISFWDADDIFTPDRLFFQLEYIENNKLDFCYSNFSYFIENKIFEHDFFTQIGWGKRDISIFDENFIGLGIITAQTDYLKKLMPFPEIQTLDWWIAIKSKLLSANYGYLNKIHGYYRIYKNSLSKKLIEVTESDFEQERKTKIAIYKEFQEEEKLIERLEFFENLKISDNFESLKQTYINKKYKNIWGGLIDYEKK